MERERESTREQLKYESQLSGVALAGSLRTQEGDIPRCKAVGGSSVCLICTLAVAKVRAFKVALQCLAEVCRASLQRVSGADNNDVSIFEF
eukprot:3662075-Amphidinium_carterae.1